MEKERVRRTRSQMLPCLLLLAATTFVLRSMGQPWWCSCGELVPWSWQIYSLHNSQHLVDPYTLTHVLHGVLLFAALRWLPSRITTQGRFLLAIAIEAGWEILENSPMIIERYRTATISLDYYGDSIANSLSDILACAAGYLFASRLRWWWSVALIVGVELLLLATIRDCLTLNVLMLVYPIEAVKHWQAG